MNDIPKGWTLERVPPPAPSKLPSQAYREGWERIFGEPEEPVKPDDD